MNEDARRDLVPALVVFFLCAILSLNWWMILIALIPLIYFLLYFLGIRKAEGVYHPVPVRDNRMSMEMFNHDHPILMPKIFYLFQAFQYFLFGVCLFWIPPVCRYFINWGKIAWNMMSASSHVLPDMNAKKQSARKKPEQFAKGQTRQGKTVYTVPAEEKVKPKAQPQAAKKPAGQRTAQAEPKPKLDQRELSRRIMQKALKEIEKNHQSLLELEQTTEEALDVMFEGSELTQNRFMRGITDAVEMSEKNLKAAREYLKIGSNPEIMQSFLKRSSQINKSAEDLIDALVKHQQGKMEENLDSLNSSLDELQDSLKYYQ